MATPNTYTFNPFLLDAGMLFIGSTPIGWGPTKGALQFDPGVEMRDPDWNGKSSPQDGTMRVVRYMSKITGQIGDKSGAALLRLLPGATSDGSTGTNVILPRDARSFISTSDTLSNVLLVHRGSDGTPAAVWFKKAIVETWTMNGEDNNEVVFDISLLALLDAADSANDPPFRLLSPFDPATFAFAGW